MKIGFLLLRQPFLKTMGGLIEACLDAGHQVLLLYQPDAARGEKAYQSVTPDSLPQFASGQPKLAEFHLDQFADLRQRHGLDVLVTHEGYHFLHNAVSADDFAQLRRAGVRLVSLSHFYEIARRPLEALELFHKTYYTSAFGRDLHFQLQAPPNQAAARMAALRDRYQVTGSPMFDQIALADPDKARAAFGIPAGKRVVLLVAPVLSQDTPWRYYVWRQAERLQASRQMLKARNFAFLRDIWRGPTFKEVVDEISAYCRRHEALLVVKSRGKQDDPPYLAEAADLMLDGYDDQYYPVFTTYQLLSLADLCITVYSMSALEAVAAGVPALNIAIPFERDVEASPALASYRQAIFGSDRPSPFNQPGCVHAVPRTQVSGWLRNHPLENLQVDPAARRAYTETYLGLGEQPSSQRILFDIEHSLARRDQTQYA